MIFSLSLSSLQNEALDTDSVSTAKQKLKRNGNI
jgi:hypothetical protein